MIKPGRVGDALLGDDGRMVLTLESAAKLVGELTEGETRELRQYAGTPGPEFAVRMSEWLIRRFDIKFRTNDPT